MNKLGLTLFACVWLASCGQGGCVVFKHPFAPDGGPCRFEELRFERFLVAGQEAKVEFGFDEKCYADIQEVFPLLLTATVDVRDPAGQSVMHVAGKPVRRQRGSSHYEDVVDVTFTPDRPGTWRLTADFGPDFGKAIQDVEVIAWRGDASMRVIPWTVPADCVGFELTKRDTVLCVSPLMPSGQKISTHRGQVLEGKVFALSGDSLWRLTGAGAVPAIERLEDDGTSFSVTHRGLIPVVAAASLAAGDDSAWLLAAAETSKGPLSLMRLVPEPDGGISIDVVEVSGRTPDGLALGDEVTLLYPDMSRLVVAPHDGGPGTPVDLGYLVGADPGTLWLFANSTPDAPAGYFAGASELRAAWAEGTAVRSARLTLPRRVFIDSNPAASFGAPLVPSSASGRNIAVEMLVVRLDGGRISLEAFDAGADYEPVSAATARNAFARALDGQSLKLFDR